MKTAILTAIYGRHDAVPPVPKGFDEAVLVSDTPINSNWKNIVHPLPIPNRLAAKIPKFRPDLFTNCESSVWMDASCRDDNDWLRGAAEKALHDNQLSAFRHPTRTCIYEEANCCADWKRHEGWHIAAQALHYKNKGYPINNGLWAGGILMRRHTQQMAQLGDRWFLENSYFSIQDQISLPYLLWDMRIQCNPLPGKIWHGPLRFVQHLNEEKEIFLLRVIDKAIAIMRKL